MEKAILDAAPGDIVIIFFEEDQLLMDVVERMTIEFLKVNQIIA
ncbi:MAG: hypothetical protein PHS15_02200 [Clostridiaceae bacterium]|nr:hypothetical protein [Clostridiaceae bacterium]